MPCHSATFHNPLLMSPLTDRSNWIPLATTLTIQALVAMAVLTPPVMAPVVARALGVSATYLGLYIAIVYVGAMVASLAAGAVTDVCLNYPTTPAAGAYRVGISADSTGLVAESDETNNELIVNVTVNP